MGPCVVKIFQYISIKMQRYTVYLYLEIALHVLGGTSTHHQERIQLYLQHLVFLTLLLPPAAIVEELELVWMCSRSSMIAAGSSNGVTNTRCCRYSCTRSSRWVVVTPETCRAVSRYNKLCKVASCWIYIGIFLWCTDPWTLNFEHFPCHFIGFTDSYSHIHAIHWLATTDLNVPNVNITNRSKYKNTVLAVVLIRSLKTMH